MSRCTRVTLCSAVCAGTILVQAAHAQDLEPRAYANTPIGLNFALAGYGYTDGDVSTDPSIPLQDGKVRVHAGTLGYARSIDVWGQSGKIAVSVPYASASGSATFEGEKRKRTVDGFGDPRFRFSVNLLGAPALSLEEFADYHQDVIVGVSLQVTAPLGQYDSSKLLNIGTNRWSIKPEVGISKAWRRFIVEVASGAAVYTDNNDFLGDHHLEKNPLYSVQTHVIYTFGWGIWGAFDFTYYTGGKTTLDGDARADLQENTRMGGTLALPIGRYNSLKLYGSTGTSARLGSNFDSIGVAWQVRWGAGL